MKMHAALQASASRLTVFEAQGESMQLGQTPYGDLQDANLAAQLQHQLRLREEQGTGESLLKAQALLQLWQLSR